MPIKLDLSKFKHVKSDDKTTTLQHQDGHMLTLAHGALHPDSQKALSALSKISATAATPDQANASRDQKMADGGKVSEKPRVYVPEQKPEMPSKQPGNTLDYNKLREEKKIINRNESSKPPQRKMMADGGDIGGVQDITGVPNSAVPQEQPQDPDRAALQQAYNTYANMGANPNDPTNQNVNSDAMFGPKGEAPKNFNPLAWKAAEEKLKLDQDKTAEATTDQAAKIAEDNQVRQRAGLPPLPNPALQQPSAGVAQPLPQAGDQSQQAPQPQVAAPQTQDSQQGASFDPYSMAQQGMNLELAGTKAGAKAQGDLGQAQAQALQKSIQDKQLAQDAFRQSFADLDGERKAHIADIQNGYIDPNKYWEGTTDKDGNQVGGHSKMASALGIILAGFNPSGKPNAAIEFLQHQMDQNLESQKANLGAKENLLSANLHQFGNLRDATDMTRLMQADVVQQQLQKAAADAATPQAAAAAQAASGAIMSKYQPIAMQLQMRQAMMRMYSQGASPGAFEQGLNMMRVVNPEAAKEMESRYVPGVGLGSTPVPAEARQKIIATKDVNDVMNRTLQFAKQNAGSVNPTVRAQGQALFNELQSKIRTAEDQGVYKESEANFMRQTLGGNPASFLANYTTAPKVRELQAIKQQEYNNLLGTYGIKGQALPKAQEGPQYKTVNGVKYMRGPNGEAVPVK